MLSEEQHSLRVKALKVLMRPIACFALRHSQSIQEFFNVAKIVFVEAAESELRRADEKVNVSRISALTGMHRHDVTPIYRKEDTLPERQMSIVVRVVGQWRHDPRFTTKQGRPRVLGYKGEDSEFHQLVRCVSQHIQPGTILFELTRMGTIEKGKNNKVKLLKQAVGGQEDVEAGFKLVAADIDTLIIAVEENLFKDEKFSNLHIRTEYDNIFHKDLPAIRKWLINEGKAFHKRARVFLSTFDKDVNPDEDEQPAGAKVSVTAFSLTPSLKDPNSSQVL